VSSFKSAASVPSASLDKDSGAKGWGFNTTPDTVRNRISLLSMAVTEMEMPLKKPLRRKLFSVFGAPL
jgi:hypothetical protein